MSASVMSIQNLRVWIPPTCSSSSVPPPVFSSPFSVLLACSNNNSSAGLTKRALLVKDRHGDCRFRLTCNVLSRFQIEDNAQVYPDSIPAAFLWHDQETLKEYNIEQESLSQVNFVTNEIRKRIHAAKSMLGSMEDGEISISAYDTAWVALVKHIDGSDRPQFPECLEWIANNQLPDGSWGDSQLFLAHDRIINTLACVVALKTWNIHPEKCEKGMKFFEENLSKLVDENDEHMPIGFEVAFPSLLDIAGSLGIQVPVDSPILKEIFAARDLKLKKIPKDILHKVPTTLLHSLEGMKDLDWKKLLKLQSRDGSFLFSPSSTAFGLMQTKDENALNYLTKIVKRFNGGVPNVYPVDLFEHVWVVDRLQRLGISRYFEQEIKECMNYVSKYWTDKGICWARNSEVQDIDDTAMGFRLLRLHGHQVSSSVFHHFEKNGEFFCFAGQSSQAVTGMFNLYRASQVLLPGENILDDAKRFAADFLTKKRSANQLLDKWIVTKDLPGEVGYALDVPWYASLPRLETRFFIEHYGGEKDIWIGKTLYRMPYVNNDVYLELAKLDYNNCQALHYSEWEKIQRWYSESRLEKFGLSKESLVFCYFMAAATIFEAERSNERLAWAKTAALTQTMTSYLDNQHSRLVFVDKFRNYYSNGMGLNQNNAEDKLLSILVRTIDILALDTFLVRGHEIAHHLHKSWYKWLSSWKIGEEISNGEAELILETINLTGGHWSEETVVNPQYQELLEVTNNVCHLLRNYQRNRDCVLSSISNGTTPEIESEMQRLVQLLLQNSSNGIDSSIKNTFLAVAKTFYYAAFFDPGTIKSHVAQVLFNRVM
ncbi:hypothetical protein L6164_010091 [Bauhinia variegata]|uniref:Uncharacterized protein n=1 Tax=Bauhinia variegata TaxID=167791 RepID=A0ACB9PNG8_BAUVA|nr:hypothetical protein L6164_010091 [Bauhinia variegata]